MRDIGRGARHGSRAVARAKKHILLAGAALETIEPLSRCLIHRARGGPDMAELILPFVLAVRRQRAARSIAGTATRTSPSARSSRSAAPSPTFARSTTAR